jgi:hypothetical protein
MPDVNTVNKLICEECGTQFNCGSTKDHSCWCVNLPNMRGQFDLAGDCLCPDCLTLGQAKAITKQRKSRQKIRDKNAIR